MYSLYIFFFLILLLLQFSINVNSFNVKLYTSPSSILNYPTTKLKLQHNERIFQLKSTLTTSIKTPNIIYPDSINIQPTIYPLKKLYNNWLIILLASTGIIKYLESYSNKKISSSSTTTTSSPTLSLKKLNEWKEIENKYLRVFWLLRFTEWMQGPYYHTIFSIKPNPYPTLLKDLPSFLTITTSLSNGLLGPFITRIIDRRNGGRLGGVLYSILATFASLSIYFDNFYLLFFGRVLAGISTPLQKVAPEAWICEQHNDFLLKNELNNNKNISTNSSITNNNDNNKKLYNLNDISLTKSFTQAYSGDSLVAVFAGIISSYLTSKYGLYFPFLISPFLLFLSGYYVLKAWYVPSDPLIDTSSNSSSTSPTTIKKNNSILNIILNEIKLSFLHIKNAINIIKNNKEIQLYGLLQVLFDTSLYLFILKWSTLLTYYGYLIGYHKKSFPYGNYFSCLMCSCFFGTNFFSYFFSKLLDKKDEKKLTKISSTSSSSSSTTTTTSPSTSKSINKFSINLLSIYLLLFSLAMQIINYLSPNSLNSLQPEPLIKNSISYYNSYNILKYLSLTFIFMEFLIGNIFPLLAYFRNYSIRNYPYYRSILTSLFSLPSAFLIFYFNSSPYLPNLTFINGRNILLLTSFITLLYYRFIYYV